MKFTMDSAETTPAIKIRRNIMNIMHKGMKVKYGRYLSGLLIP